ncbi:hypothetical protein HK20_02665 [Acetobacter sp. DsW_54]|nr:hypothetical protein HK20_02665 [Acetobacter sp. DsW_54]
MGLWQAWGSNNQPSATHMAKKTHHRVHPCLPGTPPANNARTQPFPQERLYRLVMAGLLACTLPAPAMNWRKALFRCLPES